VAISRRRGGAHRHERPQAHANAASARNNSRQVYAHAFNEPGSYEYLCLPHMHQLPMREATITVD
jgi:plastocyanin